MKKPINGLLLFAALMFSVISSGVANAQNAQWNALFDRIIRLEANVKNMARGGGGGVRQNSGDMRQILSEIRQMRQQLLSMDARLRRLEKNSGRSGKLRRKKPPVSKTTQLPPRNPTFSNNDLNQYGVSNEPQIFVEIGEPKTQPGAFSEGVRVAPIARSNSNWQSAPAAVTPRAPVVPQNNGGTNGQTIAAVPPVNPNGQPGVERGVLDGAQLTQNSVAKKLYDRSAAALRGRRYGAAESGFKSFLRKYSSNKLASGAQFMLGETFYVQRNYRMAAQNYLKGYRAYPKGSKAGDTLLKLGMALGKLGQKGQSCGAFETVVKKYKASGQVVKRARKEMVRARC